MPRKFAQKIARLTALMMYVFASFAHSGTHAVANAGAAMKTAKKAAGILTNPAATFPDMSDIVSGEAAFAVTAEHIALLRKLRFSWETAETGAPMVDPQLPYGTPDALAAIGGITGAKTETGRARQHIEIYFAMSKMLRHGSLAPGDYPLRNVKSNDIDNVMSGYFEEKSASNSTALGLTPDGKFRLTDEHLTLIKILMFDWPSEDQAAGRLDNGEWPAPTMDPKRPYSDMSYFQSDMAQILGLEVATEGGEKVLTEDQEKALQHLHWQMLGALQVFVENAEFKPGVYK